MKKSKRNLILVLAVIISACSEESASDNKVAVENKTVSVKREVDIHAFSRGQKLYLSNCAKCHGKNAEGDKNWRSTDDDGKYPSPPLNGTAHTWHHSTTVLVNTIKNGTAKIGGNMPAWKNKLTDNEILDILVWIKALWPDEIYAVWYKNHHQEK